MAVSRHTMSNPLLRTLLLVASCYPLYSAEDLTFRDPAASLSMIGDQSTLVLPAKIPDSPLLLMD